MIGQSDPRKQIEAVLANLEKVLQESNSDLTNIIKLNVYVTEPAVTKLVQQILSRLFNGPIKPAVCFVTSALPEKGAVVGIDAVAATTQSLDGRGVKGPGGNGAHLQKGVYSSAVLPPGSKIYLSGMADTNNLPEATRKTLEKLVAALGHLGGEKSDIVQLKAFLQPMSEVAAVRKEIVSFFQGTAPPMVFVEWISPSPNPPIEIELIATAKGDEQPDSVSFLTPPGTTSSKVFSRVARVNCGQLIYVSGLYGMKARDGAGQVREMFHLLGEILQDAGSDFEHLAKATYYVSDDEASNKLNDIRPEFFNPQRPPAASKAKVIGVGTPGKTVTMDMIAVTK